MEQFVIRLLIVIGLIWLTDFLLTKTNLKTSQPSVSNLVMVIIVLILLAFLVFGLTFIH